MKSCIGKLQPPWPLRYEPAVDYMDLVDRNGSWMTEIEWKWQTNGDWVETLSPFGSDRYGGDYFAGVGLHGKPFGGRPIPSIPEWPE